MELYNIAQDISLKIRDCNIGFNIEETMNCIEAITNKRRELNLWEDLPREDSESIFSFSDIISDIVLDSSGI